MTPASDGAAPHRRGSPGAGQRRVDAPDRVGSADPRAPATILLRPGASCQDCNRGSRQSVTRRTHRRDSLANSAASSQTWVMSTMVLALQATELRSASGRPVPRSWNMDNLRWWLLLLAAVLFSMSGCVSKDQWNNWASHPSHYASGNHWEFSQRTGGDVDPKMISAADQEVAVKEGWWGDLVPLAPPVDLTGNWVGTWKGLGLFD